MHIILLIISLISTYIKSNHGSNHGKLNHKWLNPSLGGTIKNHIKEWLMKQKKPNHSFSDAPPSSSMDLLQVPKWKQWKEKESSRAPLLAALRG
jgi:hypothetical protein